MALITEDHPEQQVLDQVSCPMPPMARCRWMRRWMAELFGRERSVISKHIGNAFKEGELAQDATCAKFAHVAFVNITHPSHLP